MDELQMELRTTPRGMVAKFIGDANVDHLDEMNLHMVALAKLPAGVIVADLSGLSYIGSIALGMLIHFRNESASRGGRFLIACAQPKIIEAIKTARLQKVLELYPTVDSAFASK